MPLQHDHVHRSSNGVLGFHNGGNNFFIVITLHYVMEVTKKLFLEFSEIQEIFWNILKDASKYY